MGIGGGVCAENFFGTLSKKLREDSKIIFLGAEVWGLISAISQIGFSGNGAVPGTLHF